MERRWWILAAGSLFGVALGLAVLEGVPERPPEFLTHTPEAGIVSTRDFLESPKREISETKILDSVIGVSIGTEAPDFTLSDLDGNSLRLSDFRGQVVLVNFWATWCGPCRVEMPAFQKRYEQAKDAGFIVLAVNFNEPERNVREFQAELGLTFPLLLDPGAEVQRLYQIRGYPSSVFINRAGRVEFLHVGVLTESQLDFYLNALGIES
ncbi:MAG: redoxin domain-containing protein [Anaerolineales bacterium]|nr:redoxin domain-containing protein [Anaerolineales bacterium]